MKKIISLVMAFCMLSGIFAVVVYAKDPEYEKRDVTTYVFSLDNVKTTSCVFSDILPDVPYIDPVDYLSAIYTDEFSQNNNGDGTYTVTAPNGAMIADVGSDTLSFASFEDFSSNHPNNEGSSLNIEFITGYEDLFGESKGLLLDLGKYGIDVLEYDGKVYLPLPTISAIFSSTYSNAEYVDGSVYYLHSMDDMSRDGYFDKSAIYNVLERSEEMAAFTYANFCFSMDCFFGKPTNAVISTDIAEKGVDRALEEYDDLTKEAKQRLQSTDVCDYLAALCVLSPYFFDGGHTSLFNDPLVEAGYYMDSLFINELTKRIKSGEDPFYNQALTGYRFVAEKGAGRAPFIENRSQAYSAYEPVIKWDDTTYLLVDGDTAVFVFDSFVVDSAAQFKEALDYAAGHGIGNFIIDVSGNGGGLVAVAYYMMTSMLSKRTGSNEFKSYSMNVTTGNIREFTVEADLNLDGVINDDDGEVSYDMNFGVLTSEFSFSSGNLLPVLAKEHGIAVLGEVSGGGACAIQKLYFADSHYIFMSSNTKFYVLSGADVDLGAPVDYELTTVREDGMTDYSGLFDIAHLGELLKDYYACKEHVRGDAVKENEVGPTCTEDGSYDEVCYCTVCGEEISREAKTVPASGHTAGAEVEENRVEATCAAAGSYDIAIYCSVCGEEISRETKNTDPLGHDFGEWKETKAPTENEKGEQTRVCGRCGATETEELPALEHVHELIKTEKKDSTGNENGNEEYYVCSGCGKWFRDGEGKDEITDKNSVIIPATGSPEPSSTEKTPKTGDDSALYLITVIAVLSACGAAVTAGLLHKEKRFSH